MMIVLTTTHRCCSSKPNKHVKKVKNKMKKRKVVALACYVLGLQHSLSHCLICQLCLYGSDNKICVTIKNICFWTLGFLCFFAFPSHEQTQRHFTTSSVWTTNTRRKNPK